MKAKVRGNMKKIGLFLTILIVLSGCSAARPVIRTEETSLKVTQSAGNDYKAGDDHLEALTESGQSAGLVPVNTNAGLSGTSATKPDPIKNASDKLVGSLNIRTDTVPEPGTQAPATAAPDTAPPGTTPPDTMAPATSVPDGTKADPEPNELKTSRYNLFDYYPLVENRQVDLTGKAGESSLILQYLYEESGKATAQFKQFSLDTAQVNVISISKSQITELYYSQDIGYRENIIGLKDYVERVILKAPLTVGNQWESTGLRFEITSVDEKRVINGQTFTVMDVTVSTGSEKVRFTYAVGAGLVSNDVLGEGRQTTIASLKGITDDARDVYKVDFYFPGTNGEAYLVPQTLEFKTNDATKDKLSEAYKELAARLGYTPVLGDKTQIQFLFNHDGIVHIDLNNAFVDFINKTPALEDVRLDSLVDTLCSFYDANGLILTINNQRYESANRKIEPTEILRPLSKAVTP